MLTDFQNCISVTLMEADCGLKLSGHPLCGTSDCETDLFRQPAR